MLSDDAWRQIYTGHRKYQQRQLQSVAGQLEQLAEDGGGEGASDEGSTAAHLAKMWFERDTLLGEDQAAAFVRGICRTMRSLNEDEDTGPEFARRFSGGSLGYITGETVYTMCKESKLPTCVMEPAKEIIDGVFELGMCAKDQPTCLRGREQCLGQCSGNATAGLLSQDFITSFAKQELGTLTRARLAAGSVNATIRSTVLQVPMFPLTGSFVEYTARLRVRGGFTAISAAQCKNHPESCAVIQHVLERAPTLTYIVGKGFRHVYSTTVVQPPPPSPPPRLIQYQTGSPAAPPPPPPSPPPWFSGAEQCSPIITAAEAGLQDTITIERERATCAFVRSILDERVDARRCFTADSFVPSPPPPPNNFEAVRAMVDTMLKHEEQKKHGRAGAEGAPPLGDEEQYAQQQAQSIASTVSLVETLAANNFQLRETLAGVKDKIHTGRRLFEASARSYSLKANSLQNEFRGTLIGDGPLLGLTSTECSSLCTALGNETSQTGCVATATRMLFPEDLSDLSVAACWLLKGLGSCTALDFAAQLYSRRDTSPCDLPSEWQNPLCINLQPEAPFDRHILTFSMAASACRNGRGRPRLPRAYSSLESMSFVSYARERGKKTTKRPAHTQSRCLRPMPLPHLRHPMVSILYTRALLRRRSRVLGAHSAPRRGHDHALGGPRRQRVHGPWRRLSLCAGRIPVERPVRAPVDVCVDAAVRRATRLGARVRECLRG